jgi:hypothetical protein
MSTMACKSSSRTATVTVTPDHNMLNRLPPELRNRVYEYALTGKNYHVYCRGGERAEWPRPVVLAGNLYKYPDDSNITAKLKTMRTAFPNTRDRPGTVFASETWRYWFSYAICKEDLSHQYAPEAGYLLRHTLCKGDVPDLHHCFAVSGAVDDHAWTLPTALLKASKHIKDEAASIFFAGNTFTFENPIHLELFALLVLRRPKERNALRSIELHGKHRNRKWYPGPNVYCELPLGYERCNLAERPHVRRLERIADHCALHS